MMPLLHLLSSTVAAQLHPLGPVHSSCPAVASCPAQTTEKLWMPLSSVAGRSLLPIWALEEHATQENMSSNLPSNTAYPWLDIIQQCQGYPAREPEEHQPTLLDVLQ